MVQYNATRQPIPKAGLSAHGMAIANLLAGEGKLIDARLFNANVFSGPAHDPVAGVDDIARAVSWLLDNDVRLINISLAGPYNKILDLIMRDATRKGAVFAAPVGNDGHDSPARYPAAFDDVIAVTAVDRNGMIYERAVVGAHVDLAAPGVDLVIPASGGVLVTGTSFAVPHIVSYIAADASIDDRRDVEKIRAALSARSLDLGAPGLDPVYGAGVLAGPLNCAQPAVQF